MVAISHDGHLFRFSEAALGFAVREEIIRLARLQGQEFSQLQYFGLHANLHNRVAEEGLNKLIQGSRCCPLHGILAAQYCPESASGCTKSQMSWAPPDCIYSIKVTCGSLESESQIYATCIETACERPCLGPASRAAHHTQEYSRKRSSPA